MYFIIKWFLISSIIGVCVGSASAGFLVSLDCATNFRESHLWLIALLPIGGLLIGLLYNYLGKDIEAGKVILKTEQSEHITIESDGQQVGLSSAGLVNASCTCPATGACKHIVAAVLYLQQHLQKPVLQPIKNLTTDSAEDIQSTTVESVEQHENNFQPRWPRRNDLGHFPCVGGRRRPVV